MNIMIFMFKVTHLLFGDVFNNFWNMSHKIYEIDSARYFSVSRTAWQATLKILK